MSVSVQIILIAKLFMSRNRGVNKKHGKMSLYYYHRFLLKYDFLILVLSISINTGNNKMCVIFKKLYMTLYVCKKYI